MKRYKQLFIEKLSNKERKELQKELDNLDKRIKDSAFIDPMDMRRRDEVYSLLLSGGESKDITVRQKSKRKNPKRVAPFNPKWG